MGFNTSVVLLNDAFSNIENDKEFGKKLVAAAMRAYSRDKPEDVSAGCFCNAATVIESHHASGHAVVAIGGNCGTVIGYSFVDIRNEDDETKLKVLKDLADQMGYTVSRKRTRKVKQ